MFGVVYRRSETSIAFGGTWLVDFESSEDAPLAAFLLMDVLRVESFLAVAFFAGDLLRLIVSSRAVDSFFVFFRAFDAVLPAAPDACVGVTPRRLRVSTMS